MATTNFREKEREAAKIKAKAREKRRRKRQLITSLVVILIVSIIVVCVLSVTVLFKIKTINIVGSTTYTAEEIISAAGIEVGDNLMLASARTITEGLTRKLPFVDEAEIKREFPNALTIKIKETKEQICFKNNKYCYSANTNGKVIKEYEQAPNDLILVTVSENVNFTAGENIVFLNERECELFDKFISLLEDYNYKINFINISDSFSSYIKIDDRMIVKFGSSSYFENKASYLKAGMDGISENAEGVFDLSAWTPENNKPVLTYGDISSYEK
ncbi:MAG: FtsQ-type POTRA domain-containing protein [Clostridia bacterium]|nr:FtsQ-type POTRA domain-containing protein [Clostridia bacterium]